MMLEHDGMIAHIENMLQACQQMADGSIESKAQEKCAGVMQNTPLIIAVDGGSGSGKTTLGEQLKKYFGSCCEVVHMDDFFLRPEQRTPERLQSPGGNVDYERVLQEVLVPLRTENRCAYRPFSCKNMSLMETVTIEAKQLVILEGAYSCHPVLWDYANLHIFLNIEKNCQHERIAARNGAYAQMFFEKWIPMEEAYFDAFDIRRRCEVRLDVE